MSGLHNKYTITRNDGSSAPGKKHEHCAYFVLDLEHDEYAIGALKAYARACAKEHPDLSADLRKIITAHAHEESTRCNCREVGCPHSLGQSFAIGANQTAIEIIQKAGHK